MLRLPIHVLAALMVLFASTFWISESKAEVPPFLVQQGKLLDSNGDPVSGETTFVFSIYDAVDSMVPLWTETQAITLDGGFFSTILGEVTPIDLNLFDGSVLYLGVKVGADDEMTPRQALTSVPYAAKAGSSDTASTAESVEWTGISGFPAACPAPQFLRGYDVDGNAVCGDPQSLSCTNRVANNQAASAAVTCQAGEVITGGGCFAAASQSLRYSYPYYDCGAQLCLACLIPTNGSTTCNSNAWACGANGGASTNAYALCCSLD